jgi:hypothetical protein
MKSGQLIAVLGGLAVGMLALAIAGHETTSSAQLSQAAVAVTIVPLVETPTTTALAGTSSPPPSVGSELELAVASIPGREARQEDDDGLTSVSMVERALPSATSVENTTSTSAVPEETDRSVSLWEVARSLDLSPDCLGPHEYAGDLDLGSSLGAVLQIRIVEAIQALGVEAEPVRSAEVVLAGVEDFDCSEFGDVYAWLCSVTSDSYLESAGVRCENDVERTTQNVVEEIPLSTEPGLFAQEFSS